MNAARLAAVTLTLGTLVACNVHPLEDSQMGNYTGIVLDDGDGDGSGGAEEGETDGADGAETDGEDGDGDDDVPVACDAHEYQVDALRPAVMLVLDKSGSMSDEWSTGMGNQTRWSSLHGVVSELLDPALSEMTLGVALFPAEGQEPGCSVPDGPVVELGDDYAPADVLEQIPDADDETHGYTPMREGLGIARDALLEVDEDRPRAMVLVTDGVANCADPDDRAAYDAGVEEIVRHAHEELGISTYVVGIDISDELEDYAGIVPAEEIAKVARAGGVAHSDEQPFYAVTDETALDDALQGIADRVACTIQLAEPVGIGHDFEVAVGGEILPRVDDCSAEDGWRFTDEGTRSAIELCGSACGALEVEGRVATESCGIDPGLVAEEPTVYPVP